MGSAADGAEDRAATQTSRTSYVAELWLTDDDVSAEEDVEGGGDDYESWSRRGEGSRFVDLGAMRSRFTGDSPLLTPLIRGPSSLPSRPAVSTGPPSERSTRRRRRRQRRDLS